MPQGQKPYKRTDYAAGQVKTMASFGIPQDKIAEIVGVCETTLKKYYKDELTLSNVKAVAKVANQLFNSAMGGVQIVSRIIKDKDGNEQVVDFKEFVPPNVTAQIFFLKTQGNRVSPGVWSDRGDSIDINHKYVMLLPPVIEDAAVWERKAQAENQRPTMLDVTPKPNGPVKQ